MTPDQQMQYYMQHRQQGGASGAQANPSGAPANPSGGAGSPSGGQ